VAGAFLVITLLWSAGAFALDRYGQRRPSAGQRYDAIVVLGCRVRPDGSPSFALARRTRLAVELFEAGHAPLLVFTGGVGEFPPSEAAAAARLARHYGVPASAIHLEDASTSTEENARMAAEETAARDLLLVSDAYHLARARLVFARYFPGRIEVAGSLGIPSQRIRGSLREVFAISAYALLGRLS
jgi:uncharacterized SAM-binding protein YcdF (DUF218 family)